MQREPQAGVDAPRTPDRRSIVRGLGLRAEVRVRPHERTDPRLIIVILRGALDGLATVAPLGDPDYARLHGSIALSSSGDNAALPLDSVFSLHPAMPNFARFYRGKNALVVHAVATGYRERSHFDGQRTCWKSGYSGPGRVQNGWELNRALEELPRGERVTGALAVGPTAPLILRGAAPTVGWAPVNVTSGGGRYGEPSARSLTGVAIRRWRRR